jgi:hypothetical protein
MGSDSMNLIYLVDSVEAWALCGSGWRSPSVTEVTLEGMGVVWDWTFYKVPL